MQAASKVGVSLVALKLAESCEAAWGSWHPLLRAVTQGEGGIPSFLVSLTMNT